MKNQQFHGTATFSRGSSPFGYAPVINVSNNKKLTARAIHAHVFIKINYTAALIPPLIIAVCVSEFVLVQDAARPARTLS